jgi:hypothetical protein
MPKNISAETDSSNRPQQCKYCYTGEANCLRQPRPFGTLILGGISDESDFVRTVEVFVDGKGPYDKVMHVSGHCFFRVGAGLPDLS